MRLAVPIAAGTVPVGRSLAWEIAAVLAFKAVALVVLYVAFFGPPYQKPVTADRAVQALLGPAPALPEE